MLVGKKEVMHQLDPKERRGYAVDWLNPHSYLYLDVPRRDGKATNWAMDGFPPNRLVREGWTRDTPKPGDTITIQGLRGPVRFWREVFSPPRSLPPVVIAGCTQTGRTQNQPL